MPGLRGVSKNALFGERYGGNPCTVFAYNLRPIVIDFYCGAGGAAKGYHDAGFRVIGIDIAEQPHYPYEFLQMDALLALRVLASGNALFVEDRRILLENVAFMHASPPCQAYSDLQKQNKNSYPDLIVPTRSLLHQTGKPYVIENVEGAPLIAPIKLCGASVNFPTLRVIRHRLFESNLHLVGTPCPVKHPLVFTHDKRKNHYGRLDQHKAYVQVTGGGNCTVAAAKNAMGIDWMTKQELNEAIPPAYTLWIGRQVMMYV